VNIGNTDEVTIKELAEEIIRLTGTESQIVHEELPADDPQVRQPDTAKAREALGWEASVSREEGLRRTLDYFREAVTGKSATPPSKEKMA
ncbi:MAG: NAD-dependent dehydratase, partial [Bacteroidetes bacterium QH_2_67_10]